MQFRLNDHQVAFRESLRRTLDRVPHFADRMHAASPPQDANVDLIRQRLADLGVFGILAPETVGGLGLGFIEAAVASIEFGRAALPFPASEVVLATAVVAKMRPEAAEDLIAGTSLATCAVDGNICINGGRIYGDVVAPFAPGARWVTVPLDDREVIVIDLAGPGVSLSPLPSMDLSLTFRRVTIDAPDDGQRVPFPLTRGLRLLGSAEMTGAAQRCLDLAVTYLKQRTQFQQVIGRNQALRHIAANDSLACDTMEISVEYAAWAMDQATDDVELAVAAARAGCADHARNVAEHAVQMHGGIGFTWEYGLHLYLRRIVRLASHFGGITAEQRRLADLALDDDGTEVIGSMRSPA